MLLDLCLSLSLGIEPSRRHSLLAPFWRDQASSVLIHPSTHQAHSCSYVHEGARVKRGQWRARGNALIRLCMCAGTFTRARVRVRPNSKMQRVIHRWRRCA